MHAEQPTPTRYDPTDEQQIIRRIKQQHPNFTDQQIRDALEKLIKEGILIRIQQ